MQSVSFNARVLGNAVEVGPIHLLTVAWDAATPAPVAGQFYMLRAWGAHEAPLLSRPISVHSFDAQTGALAFLYEEKGRGTHALTQLRQDDCLRLTGPAGNGFPVETLVQLAAQSGVNTAQNTACGKAQNGAESGVNTAQTTACGKAQSGAENGVSGAQMGAATTAQAPASLQPIALVGGGIGIAPLQQLAAVLRAQGVCVHFYGGYRSFTFGVDEITPLCERVEVSTETGVFGYKGYVTDLLDPALYAAVCTCGPEIMMQKVAKLCAARGVPVWVSKEAKMACGLGACLGCTCKQSRANGEKPLSVCKDGPVFKGGDVYD